MSATYTERDHDYEPSRLEVCVDCLLILANGDLGGDEEDRTTEEVVADITREWGGLLGLVTGDVLGQITLGRIQEEDETETEFEENTQSEDEGWFSMSGCECCGSSLGGQRFYATAWLPIPTEENTA